MDRVPLLSLGDALLVSIQIDLDDETVIALQDDLAERIVSTGARGVVIDISGVEIVDSFIGRMFGSIAALSRVLDAETVVVGMRPAVAITLVELGLSLDGVRTALNVERGLAILRKLTAAREPRLADDDDIAFDDRSDDAGRRDRDRWDSDRGGEGGEVVASRPRR